MCADVHAAVQRTCGSQEGAESWLLSRFLHHRRHVRQFVLLAIRIRTKLSCSSAMELFILYNVMYGESRAPKVV